MNINSKTTEGCNRITFKIYDSSKKLITGNAVQTNSSFYYREIDQHWILASDKSKLDSRIQFNKDVYYIKFEKYISDTNTYIDIQLEEGTVATPYEPYQEHKLTILSPTQIEKVDDVADRIVEKDGVWGVDKNVATDIYNDKDAMQDRSSHFVSVNTITIVFTDTKFNIYTRESICKYFKPINMTHTDEEGYSISINGSVKSLYIRILRSKLTENTINGVKKWIASNNIILKYKTDKTVFIPLPQAQQIKLRTFANKTNISFLTEIEGTIKADIPKSLGATVNTHTTQIDNLNNELERVKKLEEATTSTVVTESDFACVEQTSNGYFENVELKGRTLVNLAKMPSVKTKTFDLTSASSCQSYGVPTQKLKPLTTYTAFISFKLSNLIEKSSSSCFWLELMASHNPEGTLAAYSTPRNVKGVDGVNTRLLKFTTRADLKEITNIYTASIDSSGDIEVLSLLLLEGDHTQNPPPYFEGLASVGDGTDEIVVSSVDGDGNLFDGELELGTITNGVNAQSDTQIRSKNYIILNNLQFSISSISIKNFTFTFYDVDKKVITEFANDTPNWINSVPKNATYLRFRTWSSEKNHRPKCRYHD